MSGVGVGLLLDGASPATSQSASEWPIVELRQYTLKAGQRDTLISLFESEFIESQEVAGMRIFGTFRDLDRPDRFVWLRGFDDMEARRKSLSDFYGGPVWAEHKKAANATMISSDDVLLLAPACPGSAFDLAGAERGRHDAEDAIVTATIFYVEPTREADFAGAANPNRTTGEQRQAEAASATFRRRADTPRNSPDGYAAWRP